VLTSTLFGVDRYTFRFSNNNNNLIHTVRMATVTSQLKKKIIIIIIIIIITDLYIAFGSEDTEALDAAQED